MGEHGPEMFGAWVDRGIVLGALGGLAGFIASGFVHYNWGDSTVMMIFYFMMGLSLVIYRENEARRVAPTIDSGRARHPRSNDCLSGS